MADPGIVLGKPYRLIHKDRGPHIKAHTNWDWLFLADKKGDHGEPVVFHEYGNGQYLIESTYSNWGGYTYWTRSTTGIHLNTRDAATPWRVVPGGRAWSLEAEVENDEVHVAHSCSSPRWLLGYSEVMPNFQEFCHFTIVPA